MSSTITSAPAGEPEVASPVPAEDAPARTGPPAPAGEPEVASPVPAEDAPARTGPPAPATHTGASLARKYVLAPHTRDNEVWHWYQKAFASFWSVKEVDLSHDAKDWDTLTAPEQKFLKEILAFFASADGIVAENAMLRFYAEFESTEVRCFYGFQTMIENVHNEMYSELLQCYVKDPVEQEALFLAIETSPYVQRKADWARTWMDSDRDLATRLFAFACVEGVFFSGSFCAIFWMKKRGLMPGLTFSNELISRDEGLHCDFACFMHTRLMRERPAPPHAANATPRDARYDIMDEAVGIELDFVRNVLPVALLGINADSMSDYIRFVADRLLQQVGLVAMYGARNPFDWMELISLQGKSNFFEKRVAEYQLPGVMTPKGVFSLDDDF
jgi:ribonucleoside-diphosphate reductase beta chain